MAAQKSTRGRTDGPSANKQNTQLPDSVDAENQSWNSSDFNTSDRAIKEALDSQPKVRIKLYQVPKDSSDEKWPDEYVHINGYGYQIKRGETVEVPETVAEVLEQAGRL